MIQGAQTMSTTKKRRREKENFDDYEQVDHMEVVVMVAQDVDNDDDVANVEVKNDGKVGVINDDKGGSKIEGNYGGKNDCNDDTNDVGIDDLVDIEAHQNGNNDDNSNNNEGDEDNFEDNDDDDDFEPDEDDNDDEYIDDDYDPLREAIMRGESSDTILALIESNTIAVRQESFAGDYPLHLACYYGLPDNVVMRLIELFPEAVKHENDLGLLPFHIGCRYEASENVMMKLIETFPEISNIMHCVEWFEGCALTMAIDVKQSEAVIRKLIDLNPKVLDGPDRLGYCPVHHAVNSNLRAVVTYMLELSPGLIHRKVLFGQTPLDLAVRKGDPELVQYMINRFKIPVNSKRDEDGATLLHFACRDVIEEIVEILLQQPGINVNATNTRMETPLHQLIRSNHEWNKRIRIVQKVLDHPHILIEEKDGLNKTPLDIIKRLRGKRRATISG
jgi:ankyrin repeat protein